MIERNFRIVILAAGLGTRLGGQTPKPLTPLANRESIIERQIRLFRKEFGENVPITVVVGYKAEEFYDRLRGVEFVVSNHYASTGTAESLRLAFETYPNDNILWANGDVVFTEGFSGLLKPAVLAGSDFMMVCVRETGEEEVKFRRDSAGRILDVGKNVRQGDGEAIGVNFVGTLTATSLKAPLHEVRHSFYEEALCISIQSSALRLFGVEFTEVDAVEVDTPLDMEVANDLISAEKSNFKTKFQAGA